MHAWREEGEEDERVIGWCVHSSAAVRRLRSGDACCMGMRVLGGRVPGGVPLFAVRSHGRLGVVGCHQRTSPSSKISLSLPEGAWSWIQLGPLAIGMAEGIELAFPPVREPVGEVSLLVFHFLPTGVVVAKGRGVVQKKETESATRKKVTQ